MTNDLEKQLAQVAENLTACDPEKAQQLVSELAELNMLGVELQRLADPNFYDEAKFEELQRRAEAILARLPEMLEELGGPTPDAPTTVN